MIVFHLWFVIGGKPQKVVKLAVVSDSPLIYSINIWNRVGKKQGWTKVKLSRSSSRKSSSFLFLQLTNLWPQSPTLNESIVITNLPILVLRSEGCKSCHNSYVTLFYATVDSKAPLSTCVMTGTLQYSIRSVNNSTTLKPEVSRTLQTQTHVVTQFYPDPLFS